MWKLERRELAAEYDLETHTVSGRDGTEVPALVAVTKPAIATQEVWGNGRLDRAFKRAHGSVGTGVEYVRAVVHVMELHALDDPFISELWTRLKP